MIYERLDGRTRQGQRDEIDGELGHLEEAKNRRRPGIECRMIPYRQPAGMPTPAPPAAM